MILSSYLLIVGLLAMGITHFIDSIWASFIGSGAAVLAFIVTAAIRNKLLPSRRTGSAPQ